MRRADADLAPLRAGVKLKDGMTLPAGAKPPVTAFRIGDALALGEAAIVLDGFALTETEGLGFEHR